MSATRLLVLGAVRIFQPAHGYLVRRELLSWDVENWAAINPGSIYNMLRTLTRDGLLAEVDAVNRVDAGKGPARVAYQLTPDGETAFLGLLTSALWEISERDPYLLPAGLCFVTMLTRKQATEALEGREAAIALRIRSLEARGRMLLEQRRVPPHTVELLDLGVAHLTGELRWVREARERIESGHYRFADEPGSTSGPVDGHWYGPLEKPPSGGSAPRVPPTTATQSSDSYHPRGLRPPSTPRSRRHSRVTPTTLGGLRPPGAPLTAGDTVDGQPPRTAPAAGFPGSR